MFNAYKPKLLISTLSETKPFDQTLFKSIKIENGGHFVARYLGIPQMRYSFENNILRVYEMNDLLIKEYRLKEKVVNLVLDETCERLFLLTENRILKITKSECAEHLFTFPWGSEIEVTNELVFVKFKGKVTVFDSDLNQQKNKGNFTQIVQNNKTVLRIKENRVEFQTPHDKVLAIEYNNKVTTATTNTLLSHIYAGTDDGTLFVQSLEGRPVRRLKVCENAIEKLQFTFAEDMLIAHDKMCLAVVCTKTFVLLERYEVKDITNVSVLEDPVAERSACVIDVPRQYFAY